MSRTERLVFMGITLLFLSSLCLTGCKETQVTTSQISISPEEALLQRATGYGNVIKDILSGTGDDETNAQSYAKYHYPLNQITWDSIRRYIQSTKQGVAISHRIYAGVEFVSLSEDGKTGTVLVTWVSERTASPTEKEPVGYLRGAGVLTYWQKIHGEWYYDHQQLEDRY